ncbi:glutamyl-tRNA synthetase [Nitzschia inconspicua]|uniref:glutamine--tRNA ligase n=1 Tax=Nitzschia inconspicua TaxID=303405 RepID=A0A9K3K6L0_9STRA|nr:glutamyl/glutaminyl-tRNA synthetase [Nitzschia inconspicua]KAG7369332.1 glutamyl-tRNA synthetase [Nitzschia inconspicua]
MGEQQQQQNNTDNEDAGSSSTTTTKNPLSARELEWANNPPELIQQHQQTNGSIIRTRFPPEPNGYLHVGHAKSMNMNFRLAFEKLNVPMEDRRTVFRYDDTNPDAETKEYIDSLYQDLTWLGWKPEKTTYSSDNFQTLYELALKLIRKGLAYCCDMTKAEMEIQRELAMKRALARNVGKDPDLEAPVPSPDVLPGRNRDTSVERNLEIFQKMKLGMMDEGSWTLRLKMDFESSNPNMYDLVAYRIKFTPHPHAGDGWCIYPAYDFTHGICDSLEDIDYSICTLEFESRREPYYWILWALDMFRPAVYEMSRLNLQYTVLSKRRLLKLVHNHHVRGWDDPRMPTISGYRRRGFTPDIINSFCMDLGATRAANVIEMEKLFNKARTILSDKTQRAMAVLSPILVTITNWDENKDQTMIFEVQNSPTDPSLGSHTVELTSTLYIDATDFRMEDDPDYYGLAPNKAVGLKYHGGNLICDQVISDDENGKVKELKCRLDNTPEKVKPKTHISWVSATLAIPCEIRVYNHLFTVPEPSDLWEEELNPESEIVYENGFVDPSVKDLVDASFVDKWKSNQALQFERMGYFVVDLDTTFDSKTGQGRLVFNRTVTLKEEVFKKKATNVLSKQEEEANTARKLKQKADMEAKEARMKISPKELFQLADEYKGLYSKFDPETGLPTHEADGTELTKSAIKKLKKLQDKHEKELSKWKK